MEHLAVSHYTKGDTKVLSKRDICFQTLSQYLKDCLECLNQSLSKRIHLTIWPLKSVVHLSERFIIISKDLISYPQNVSKSSQQSASNNRSFSPQENQRHSKELGPSFKQLCVYLIPSSKICCFSFDKFCDTIFRFQVNSFFDGCGAYMLKEITSFFAQSRLYI